MSLFLRREQVFETLQRKRITVDAESGDDALAHGGGLRGRAASDRVRDMDLDRRELDLRQRRDERRITGAERCRVEDRGVDALVVRLIDPIDDFALDIRVEDLDL